MRSIPLPEIEPLLRGQVDIRTRPDDLHPNTEGYRLMGERFHALMLAGDTPLIAATAWAA